MTPIKKSKWVRQHLFKQKILCWLLDHHIITNRIAELLDDKDNKTQEKKIKKEGG